MKSKKVCLIIILIILATIGSYYLVRYYSIKSNVENETNITEYVITEAEAKKLIDTKWELAMQLYTLSDTYFDWGQNFSEMKFTKDEKGYEYGYYQLHNYYEVLEKYFSPNMFSDFEKNAVCLEKINNIPCIVEGDGGFYSYDGIEEIFNVQITLEKITAIIKTRHVDGEGNFLEYRESPFTLVKSGDNWLINEYTYEILR